VKELTTSLRALLISDFSVLKSVFLTIRQANTSYYLPQDSSVFFMNANGTRDRYTLSVAVSHVNINKSSGANAVAVSVKGVEIGTNAIFANVKLTNQKNLNSNLRRSYDNVVVRDCHKALPSRIMMHDKSQVSIPTNTERSL
jgi:hypothetical protein